MQAIRVKVLPATERRPKRYKAIIGNGRCSLIMSADSIPGPTADRERYVATQLAIKYSWPWRMVEGFLGNDAVFTFDLSYAERPNE